MTTPCMSSTCALPELRAARSEAGPFVARGALQLDRHTELGDDAAHFGHRWHTSPCADLLNLGRTDRVSQRGAVRERLAASETNGKAGSKDCR